MKAKRTSGYSEEVANVYVPEDTDFDKKVKLPPYKSSVKFKHLQACEVDNNVWFKAEDIVEA